MDASQTAWSSQIQSLQAQLQHCRTQIEALPETPQQQQLARSISDVMQQLATFTAVSGIVLGALSSQTITQISKAELYPGLLEILPIGVFLTDESGQTIYVNPHYRRIFGYPLEHALGINWLNAVYPDDREHVFNRWTEAVVTGYTHRNEYRVITAQDETRWVRAQTVPILDAEGKIIGHTGTIEDITQQRLAEDQLKAALSEKEALLKEVHHRVKNNLQVISSLLYLQSNRIDDVKVRQFFDDSQSRISSMALVHDILYRSQDFARINLSEYVQTLTTHLFHTYHVQPKLVKLDLQVDRDIMVEIDQAIPCGLILNELMTNALKHGLSSEQSGHIRVSLKDLSDQVCLVVENSGKRLPESFELEQSRSMGLRLVTSLVQQLHGTVQVETTDQTRFKIIFSRV